MAETEIHDPNRVTSAIDIAAGLVLAAIAVLALFWLIPNYVTSGGGEHDIGPTFFPKLAAGVVLVLSLALVLTRAKTIATSGPGRRGRSIVLEIMIWTVISVLSVFGFVKIGFLITAPLLIVIGAIACGFRTWWIIAMLAIAFPVAVDQAAWWIFTVDLP